MLRHMIKQESLANANVSAR